MIIIETLLKAIDSKTHSLPIASTLSKAPSLQRGFLFFRHIPPVFESFFQRFTAGRNEGFFRNNRVPGKSRTAGTRLSRPHGRMTDAYSFAQRHRFAGFRPVDLPGACATPSFIRLIRSLPYSRNRVPFRRKTAPFFRTKTSFPAGLQDKGAALPGGHFKRDRQTVFPERSCQNVFSGNNRVRSPSFSQPAGFSCRERKKKKPPAENRFRPESGRTFFHPP